MPSARTADSRPEPGPLTRTSTLRMPWSRAWLAAFAAACCAAKGVPLRDPRKPSEPGTLPRHGVAVRVGDGDDRVIEGSLHVHQSVRNVLALLLLKLLRLALLVACGATSFSHKLCLCRRFLLICHRAFARSLAGTGIGVGALAANRQAAAMTIAAIRADFDQALDVHRNVFAQIAFDIAFLLNDLADAVDLVFVQVADLLVGSTFAVPRILAERESPMP